MSIISRDIQERVAACEAEMNKVIKERSNVVHGMWVTRVGQLHLVMLGPGGTGKSYLVREFVSHIANAVHFETALDETKDPGEAFGPPDIRAMVQEGRTRRVTEGMLPEATDAFVDEIFNGNSPTLHSLMPIMNERVFHNPKPAPVPLRSLYAGTNKLLDSDPDLAAFFDRLHLRYEVDYVKSRRNQADMVAEAIARMAKVGRGTITSLATSPTTVTVEELDIAHKEALALDVDDEVFGTFLDLRDALRSDGGIVISDRRMVDGMAAVKANAWVRGHDKVQIGDLDILADMWWTLQEQAAKAREIILEVANPTEKATIDLMTALDELQSQFDNIGSVHESKHTGVKVEIVRNTRELIAEAEESLATAVAAGADTNRLKDLIGRAHAFDDLILQDTLGTTDTSRLTAVR